MSELDNLPFSGIYIIAYMGKILYVGKASVDVLGRISNHQSQFTKIGVWLLKSKGDWENVRLDVLEQPDDANKTWLKDAEALLIRKFNPLFNTNLIL
jgi:hypothetical protein